MAVLRRSKITNAATVSAPKGADADAVVLPQLQTAEEIAVPLGVHPRTVHAWAADGTIPVALRRGRVVRFSPQAVAEALGLNT